MPDAKRPDRKERPGRFDTCRWRALMPVLSLARNPIDKATWAAIVVALSKVGNVILETVAVDPMLVVALVVAVIADYYTGSRAADERGEKITSTGMRQTITKTLEYAAFILLFVAIDNAFFDTGLLEYGAAGWVLRTEAKSVTENVFNKGEEKEIKKWIDEQWPGKS